MISFSSDCGQQVRVLPAYSFHHCLEHTLSYGVLIQPVELLALSGSGAREASVWEKNAEECIGKCLDDGDALSNEPFRLKPRGREVAHLRSGLRRRSSQILAIAVVT